MRWPYLWGLVLGLLTSTVCAQVPSTILVNQVGYFKGQKVRLVWIQPSEKSVDELSDAALLDLSTRKKVPYRISAKRYDSISGREYREIRPQEPLPAGRYQFHVDGVKSPVFVVGSHDLAALAKATVRTFYLQRCGVAINDRRSDFKHPQCHLEDATRISADVDGKEGSKIDGLGGWHDAGDYGKYVSTTTVAAARLIAAWQAAPQLFGDATDIPESGNGRPDILDEVAVGLDWLLKMQRSDGALYRKLSGKQWPTELRAHEDTQPRFVFGPASADTLKAAAVWALAARTLNTSFPQKSLGWKRASDKAWQQADTLAAPKVERHPDDNLGSGPYLAGPWDLEASLLTDDDDALWARIERWLHRPMLDKRSHILKQIKGAAIAPFEWKNASLLGIWHWIQSPRACPDQCPQLQRKIIDYARGSLARSRSTVYAPANLRFVWASNKLAAEEGLILLAAWTLTKERDFLDAAAAQLDYLLGLNVLEKSFVTGFGSQPVTALMHNDQAVRDAKLPGYVSGGPNTHAQDNLAPKALGMQSYLDSAKSWSTNETAIDYNASLVGLIAGLTAAFQMVNE